MRNPNDPRTFFHSCRTDIDPQRLLDPEQQRTDPWGEPEHGPCDKCAGAGEVLYECRSCLEAGAVADCPSCQGRVRFRETCPACLGDGRIDRTYRRGVAVFPTREGLYRYLAERNADIANRLIVEIEGRLAEERDLDADAGALLIHPEEIVEVRPLDGELVARIRARL
ncbi:MAG TPA: hypothetical protein VFS48_02580 [Solirubrobacterales bacterium]|nr:hypothetical protein [Solirubrobacterales bacterium]